MIIFDISYLFVCPKRLQSAKFESSVDTAKI